MKKKKLLFVISQLHKGGAEVSTVNMLNKMDPSKYEVDFLVLNQVPVKGAISLIDQIPSWITVCDAFNESQRKTRLLRGFSRRLMSIGVFSCEAVRFVEGKRYDLAIHIGEWHAPVFMASAVSAEKKAVWFHTDINRDKNFAADSFFAYDESIDEYLFVSEHSLENSCKKYPFIKHKSYLFHNSVNEAEIRLLSQEGPGYVNDGKLPVIVTVANVRPEKNHLRQLEAMRILKEKGRNFVWWNIGFKSDKALVAEVEKKACEYGLERHYILLGPKENPYPEMAQADAVSCLSDYESWSMVITEAIALNKFVIATKTSGALEQIEHGVNGYLTDFSASSIAEGIEAVLFSDCYAEGRDTFGRFNTIDELNDILERGKKEQVKRNVLFVIDDVNYPGGAHYATFNHINELHNQGVDVDVYTNTLPSYKVRTRMPHVRFYWYEKDEEFYLFTRRILEVLFSPNVSLEHKKLRFAKFVNAALKIDFIAERREVFSKRIFESYDKVCVISEGSMYKKMLAQSNVKQKIQWIHTDYCSWRLISDWTLKMAEQDEEYWKHIDTIIVLSHKFKRELEALYPSLTDKIHVVGNQIDNDLILSKADNVIDEDCVRFISCSRVSPEKNIEGILRVFNALKEKGYKFHWTLVGDGEDLNKIRELVSDNSLQKYVSLLGYRSNPYQFIKKADVLLQFSHYEGLPLTVYEAMILGKPVLATNVGAISEQITEGKNGWLIRDSESELLEKLEHILKNPSEVEEYQNNLKGYRFNNEEIKLKLGSIFK